MIFSLTVLGVSSGLPTSKRFPTAHVLNVHGHLFLIDCGEGTQIQLRRYKVKFSRINNIFISHLHGDHFFGIFGLLSSFSMLGRKNDLHIYAPKELEKILLSETSPIDIQHFNYKIVFHSHKHELGQIYEDKKLTVEAFPLQHRIEAWGFVFREKQKQPNIIKEKIAQHNLSIVEIVKLKQGGDVLTADNQLLKHEDYTIPTAKPRSYAFCSDTVFLNRIIPIVKNVDLLYHEATFLHTEKKQAKLSQHTTAKEAGIIAQKADVKQLLIGHFSARYKSLDPLLQESQKEFPNTILAFGGLTIDVEQEKNK